MTKTLPSIFFKSLVLLIMMSSFTLRANDCVLDVKASLLNNQGGETTMNREGKVIEIFPNLPDVISAPYPTTIKWIIPFKSECDTNQINLIKKKLTTLTVSVGRSVAHLTASAKMPKPYKEAKPFIILNHTKIKIEKNEITITDIPLEDITQNKLGDEDEVMAVQLSLHGYPGQNTVAKTLNFQLIK